MDHVHHDVFDVIVFSGPALEQALERCHTHFGLLVTLQRQQQLLYVIQDGCYGTGHLGPMFSGQRACPDCRCAAGMAGHAWIRTFGNHEQPTLSFVGGKNAGDYGCYWRVQCRPHTWCNIFDMYSFLSLTSSVVVSYTYHFTVDDDHLHKSTILSSVVCL